MKVSVIGSGYVGLVTGVTLSEIGHDVACIDVDKQKIEKLKKAISPIYEPGLSEMMAKNIAAQRLIFTDQHHVGLADADVIYIAVGTPENEDGSVNLQYVERAALDIASHVTKNVIIVLKSTVPVGTNHQIRELVRTGVDPRFNVEIVSNPEFLKEGSAIDDTFHGDRIVIGSDNEEAALTIAEINQPFGVPIYRTDIRSAEMIKYASNAFLATKISFINEISNICEMVGANVENVAAGMGMDQRIGNQFLKAGIGYGGSCFPKDTKALIQIAGNVDYDFELLKGVVNVNRKQQVLLIDKLKKCLDSIQGKRIAVLGLAFKPNTDDMREAASILITDELIKEGAQIVAYDPVAMEKARVVLHSDVCYANTIEEALIGSDAALILTEWGEIRSMDLQLVHKMNRPLLIDGRNCFALDEMQNHGIEYHSVGRPSMNTAAELEYVKVDG